MSKEKIRELIFNKMSDGNRHTLERITQYVLAQTVLRHNDSEENLKERIRDFLDKQEKEGRIEKLYFATEDSDIPLKQKRQRSVCKYRMSNNNVTSLLKKTSKLNFQITADDELSKFIESDFGEASRSKKFHTLYFFIKNTLCHARIDTSLKIFSIHISRGEINQQEYKVLNDSYKNLIQIKSNEGSISRVALSENKFGHCYLRFSKDGIELQDLGSSNGTKVLEIDSKQAEFLIENFKARSGMTVIDSSEKIKIGDKLNIKGTGPKQLQKPFVFELAKDVEVLVV